VERCVPVKARSDKQHCMVQLFNIAKIIIR
jgi:hypothetical protein